MIDEKSEKKCVFCGKTADAEDITSSGGVMCDACSTAYCRGYTDSEIDAI